MSRTTQFIICVSVGANLMYIPTGHHAWLWGPWAIIWPPTLFVLARELLVGRKLQRLLGERDADEARSAPEPPRWVPSLERMRTPLTEEQRNLSRNMVAHGGDYGENACWLLRDDYPEGDGWTHVTNGAPAAGEVCVMRFLGGYRGTLGVWTGSEWRYRSDCGVLVYPILWKLESEAAAGEAWEPTRSGDEDEARD